MRSLSELRRDNRGIAAAAATALATMLCIALVWSLLGPSLEHYVFGYVENQVTSGQYDYGPTAQIIHWTWAIWPLILLFGVILYLLMASQRRVQETGVYQ